MKGRNDTSAPGEVITPRQHDMLSCAIEPDDKEFLMKRNYVCIVEAGITTPKNHASSPTKVLAATSFIASCACTAIN